MNNRECIGPDYTGLKEFTTFGSVRQELVPQLPGGANIVLPGRGTTFVRFAGDPDAQPVVLLHGWAVSAAVNWFQVWPELSQQYRLVMPDHRNHGLGIRNGEAFTISACAQDVAVLCDVLELERPALFGYSMGGPVAVAAAASDPSRYAGLVLSATALQWTMSESEARRWRASFFGLRTAQRTGRLWPGVDREVRRIVDSYPALEGLSPWILSEVRQSSPNELLTALRELASFDGRFMASAIDRLPASVIVTASDATVQRARQEFLADRLGAARFTVAGGHHSVISDLGFADVSHAALEAVLNPAPTNVSGRTFGTEVRGSSFQKSDAPQS